MAGALVGAAAASVAAAAIALTGHSIGGTAPAAGTASPFGGSMPVRVGRVGRIDVDLEGQGGSLRRVRCATASATLACFVAR